MSKSNVIPQEQLPECERWEMDRFDAPGRRGGLGLPSADQIEKLYQQAQDEGFKAGRDEGRQRAAEAATRMAAIASAFTRESGELDQRIAQQVLDLALEVARQILRTTVSARPELVLPLIQEAIRSLPVLGEDRRLHAHPADAALAREHLRDTLAASGWKMVEDPALARGDCRIFTSHGEVDATLETRWRRIVASLGRDDAWLATTESA